MELHAPSRWRCVDFISDLHLQAADAATFGAWAAYMQSTPAQAVFILGDLFEVWVGDDALLPGSFEAKCASVLRAAGERLALHIMQGNRDFLMGPALMQACAATALPDPTVLAFEDQRWLLSHGDALCLDDHAYLAFRQQVRQGAWQQDFLAKPLHQRQAIARGIRHASETRKHENTAYADVDTEAAITLLHASGCSRLLHGHTHKPAQHTLDATHTRTVLSDWDMRAPMPRAEVLRLSLGGETFRLERISLVATAGFPG